MDHPPVGLAARVFVCAGPPHCLLQDEEAVRAMQDDCPWCKVVTIHADGGETEYEPGRA